MNKDDLFLQTQSHIVDFAFDEQVTRVFPDMIRRSVPGYETLIGLLGLFSEHYAQKDSRIYDLGCSLGASTIALAKRLTVEKCTIMALDNSPAMIEQCRKNTKNYAQVQCHCEDIRDTEFTRASVVVMNFTLQFIPPEERAALIQRIVDGLLPGGVFVLSEKIRFADAATDQDITELHHQFKAANGYSDLEISQKRQALENVMIPETLEAHETRLRDCGLNHVRLWHQSMNFASLYAIKA